MRHIRHKIKKYIRPYKLNIYLALLYRLIMVLLFMQQGRLAFYLFNQEFFPNTPIYSIIPLMMGGLVFDLTAVLYVNSLYIFLQILPFWFTSGAMYQRVCKWIFVVTNSLAIITNMIDVVYFRFTLRRTTSLIFKEFSNEQNFFSLFIQFFISYWYMFILTGMVITGLIVSYKLVSVRPLLIRKKIFFYPTALVIMFAVVVLFVGGVRGGFAHSTRPITISNATQYITNPGEESIVLNTPFSIIRTIGAQPLERMSYYSEEELESIYTPIHRPSSDSVFQRKNVVVIIWESLGSEYIGEYNLGRSEDNFTPFIDSLLQHSMFFTRSVASGKKSIDAMASIFASVPSLLKPFILTPYSHNTIVSLPKVFGNEGYTTSFFHGAPNGSMGMLAYSKKLEIESYYGKTEYDDWRSGNSDFDGVWGIWDDKFMEYFSYEIDRMKEPFFTSIFTLSSHHPFKVPTEYEGQFKSGGLDIHPVISYSDMALSRFFERARTQDWYKNTVFIITGDHTNQSKYPEYHTTKRQYAVPIIFFDPSTDMKDRRDVVAGQIDIFPTLLSYLDYNKPYFSFGQDLLSTEGDNFTITYSGAGYITHYKDEATVFGNAATHNDSLARAFIQQFNNRMIDNNLQVIK